MKTGAHGLENVNERLHYEMHIFTRIRRTHWRVISVEVRNPTNAAIDCIGVQMNTMGIWLTLGWHTSTEMTDKHSSSILNGG